MPTAAVVGCGDVSVVHLEAIHAVPGAELVAVCDTDAAAAGAAAGRWGVPAYEDHLRLLASVRPDVVHVCTPHHQHAEVAVAALEAGIHVVLEKPLAHTVTEAERIVQAADRSEAKIGVCFQNRYNATAQAVRALLDSRRVGEVVGAAATVRWHRTPAYYAAKPWRGRRASSGGGVLINQAIHTVDLLQWLLGEVVDVDGHVGRRVPDPTIDVEDTAQLVLTHRGGARSVLFATVAAVADAPVSIEIVTEGATLDLRGDLAVTFADGATEVVQERVGTSTGRSYWGLSHTSLIADFYDRLDDPAPFWIGPREAMKSLRILERAYHLLDPTPPTTHSTEERTTSDVDPVRVYR